MRFRLRPAQELLFRTMWYLNIILKARQLEFSTAIDIYLLDEALFNKNLKCGIIAQDLTAAGEIYRTKIEVPFDNLPGWLKAQFKVVTRRGGAEWRAHSVPARLQYPGGHLVSAPVPSSACMYPSTERSAPNTREGQKERVQTVPTNRNPTWALLPSSR